jgi:hypothetical protein
MSQIKKITRLRSCAWLEESFREDDWSDDLRKLSDAEFRQFVDPLLANKREKLMALPAWSRQLIQQRWLGK